MTRRRPRLHAMSFRLSVASVAAAVLLAVLSVLPAQAAPHASPVNLATYRIPDTLLEYDTGKGFIGYGYPPAYGFDTADHNIQCYIAPSEDSSPYVCAVQTSSWRPTNRTCRSMKYVGVLGFANAAYGSEEPQVRCSEYPVVPRERKPGSKAMSGGQVNRVLPAGRTVTYRGVRCTASGSGKAAAISCVEVKAKHGFRVSRAKLSTY